MARRALRLDNPTNIRKTLTKITNMVYNGEIDTKSANCIIVACNSALGVFKFDGSVQEITLESGGSMKNSRQYKIQSLLRMAEITDDEEKRKFYLDEAEKLVFQNVPKDVVDKVVGK
jgi:hypothetical protein